MRKPDLSLFFLRLRKLVALGTDPFFLRAFVRGRVAPAIEHVSVLRRLPFDFVADVGANRGQFSLVCRRLNASAGIVAFEPLAAPAAVYRGIFANDGRTRLHNSALGPDRGRIVMNVAGEDDASSVLSMSRIQTDNFPGTGMIAKETVAIGPLTDFIGPSDLGARNLLKIDVQGFELEVLKSAGTLLAKFEWVYAECSFVPLYEGQALAQEIVDYLGRHGFRLVGQFNPSHGRADGRLLQADLLFEAAGG